MIVFTPNTVIKSADVNFNFDETLSTIDERWYEKLAVSTLSSAGDTITATFTAKKYLKILFYSIHSGSVRAGVRFNADSGSNYAQYIAENGGAGASAISQAQVLVTAGTNDYATWALLEGYNISNQEKIFRITGMNNGPAGATNPPGNIREGAVKWANTSSQITSVSMVNTSTGDFGISTQLIVLGHD
jgi:hypothetical protein